MNDTAGTPEGNAWYQKYMDMKAERDRLRVLLQRSDNLVVNLRAAKLCTCGRPLRDTGAGVTCQPQEGAKS